MNKEVPIWERYALTIREASAYFRIGENSLRKLVAENPDAEFIKRCKAIFGSDVAKEIANTFWFWYENPALEND